MYGIAFIELNKYLNAKFGKEAWNNLLQHAGLDCDTYKASQEYLYADISSIVQATFEMTGLSEEFILEDFGEFIGVKFVDVFWYAIDPKWKTLDLLEHLPKIGNIVSRNTNCNFGIECRKSGDKEVTILYLLIDPKYFLLKGFIKGISRYYHEQIEISIANVSRNIWELKITYVSSMSVAFIEEQSEILDELITKSEDKFNAEISSDDNSALVTCVDMGSQVEMVAEIPVPQKNIYFPGYDIIKEIGAGGMGIVYKARQKSLDRFVAIKVMAPYLDQDEIFLKRLETEAKVMAQLQHPNIVSAIDFGFQNNSYYMVMEYVESQSLQDWVKNKGPMSETQVLKLAFSITNALKCLDENQLVHCDINPSNILMDKHDIPKLTDLGLVKTPKFEAELTHAPNSWIGTPQYMSTEQIQSEQDLDIRSDIYSLGTTLYYAATGKHRFRAASSIATVYYQMLLEAPVLEKDMKQFSVHFGEILYKMLEQKPENRYQDPEELITDIKSVMTGSTDKILAKKKKRSKKSKKTNVRRLSRIHCVLGNEFFHKRKFNPAIDCYDKALEIDPEFAGAYHNRGKVFQYQGNTTKAIVDYSDAINCNPILAKAYKNRGLVFIGTKNYQAAIIDFKKYLELKPNAIDTHKIKKYILQSSKSMRKKISKRKPI